MSIVRHSSQYLTLIGVDDDLGISDDDLGISVARLGTVVARVVA